MSPREDQPGEAEGAGDPEVRLLPDGDCEGARAGGAPSAAEREGGGVTGGVEIKGAGTVLHNLTDIPKQLRFATSLAVNRTVRDVQDHAILFTASRFKIRTGWLRRGGYGIQARFSNKSQEPIQGSVFVHEGTWWMKQHEEGTLRTGLNVPFIVKYPMRGKRRTFGPPQREPRKGFKVPIYSSIPSGTRREMVAQFPPGKVFRMPGTDLFFVRTGKSPRDLKLAYVFKTGVRIKADWGFYAENKMRAEEVFQKNYDQAVATALATAFKGAA